MWQKPYPSKVCTPVIHGGHVYFAWQKVRCLDWETGEQKWEGGSFGDPGSCVVTADDRLIVYGGNGKLALVETAERSPTEYKELAVRDRPLQDPRLAARRCWPAAGCTAATGTGTWPASQSAGRCRRPLVTQLRPFLYAIYTESITARPHFFLRFIDSFHIENCVSCARRILPGGLSRKDEWPGSRPTGTFSQEG